jgi:hypothetical protein
MNVPIKAIAITMALGAVLLGTGGSVSAAPMPDGGYSLLTAGTYGRGIAVVRYSGTTTVNAGVLGLMSSAEYFFTGRSISCDGQPSASNRVFRLSVTTDSEGTFFVRRSIALNDIVRSMWLVPADGSQPPACAISLNFEEIKSTFQADVALGFMYHQNIDRLALAVVEKMPNDEARASIIVTGLQVGDTYRIQGVGANCGHSVGPGERYYAYELKNVQVTSFKSKTVPLTQDEIDSLRSVRIKDTTDGTKWGCVPLNIIGMLVAL